MNEKEVKVLKKRVKELEALAAKNELEKEKLQMELTRTEMEINSHEMHIKNIYGIRRIALYIGLFTILLGSIMIFLGLEGSFDWAVESASTVNAKLTNASPGIVLVTIGLIMILAVILKRSVQYRLSNSSILGPGIHE